MNKKKFLTFFCIVLVLTACSPEAKPIPTSIPLDSDSDGLITPEEVKVTFSAMHDIVIQIAETRPDEAAIFEAEITSFEDGFPVNLDIGRISQTAYEILSVAQTINAEQGGNVKTALDLSSRLYSIIAVSVAFLLLLAFILLRRRKQKGKFTAGKAPRKVFFSFAYGDLSRALIVRDCWETQEGESAGFIDAAAFTELKSNGTAAIKSWIDEQLEGTDVTVVLVGKDTCASEWVKNAIEKSIENGNGLLGIDISKIKDSQGNKSERCGKIPEGYPFYLWNKDDGKNNIGRWIEKAAKVV